MTGFVEEKLSTLKPELGHLGRILVMGNCIGFEMNPSLVCFPRQFSLKFICLGILLISFHQDVYL